MQIDEIYFNAYCSGHLADCHSELLYIPADFIHMQGELLQLLLHGCELLLLLGPNVLLRLVGSWQRVYCCCHLLDSFLWILKQAIL